MLCKLPRHPLWAIRPHVNPASDEAREKGGVKEEKDIQRAEKEEGAQQFG